jgi:hypothetical protein
MGPITSLGRALSSKVLAGSGTTQVIVLWWLRVL